MSIENLVHAVKRCSVARLLLGSLVLASPAASLANEAEPWYQVEVIIFERLSQGQSGDAETWPKSVELGYPSDWQKLISQEDAQNMLAALVSETAEPVEPAQAAQWQSDDTFNTPQNGEASAVSSASFDVPLPPLLKVNEEPQLAYTLLPAAERTLNESAGGIARNRQMRVLFHEAWRQPIRSAEATPAVIVHGGNSYAEHTELEGSLQLSVSRYLHLHTHLWLTQFIPNYGQESEHWPPLPAVPEYKPAEIDEAHTSSEFGQQPSAWNFEAPLLDDYTNLIDEPFLIKEIVVLQQNRRMRSGELHYIDHPRIGLLIKIDEYKPEEKKQ